MSAEHAHFNLRGSGGRQKRVGRLSITYIYRIFTAAKPLKYSGTQKKRGWHKKNRIEKITREKLGTGNIAKSNRDIAKSYRNTRYRGDINADIRET